MILERKIQRLEDITKRKVVDIRDYRELKEMRAMHKVAEALKPHGLIMRDTHTGKPI